MDREDARLLVDAGAALGTPVDSGTLARLGRFLDLLVVWNQRIRLTGEQDPSMLLRRHVIDCLAPGALLPSSGLVVDIGAGGGFPGLVLGCLRPDLELVLVEPRRRPRSFLAEAIRVIPLPKGRALEARGEELSDAPELRGLVGFATSRALRLDLFLPLAEPLLAPDGIAVAMQTPGLTERAAVEVGAAAGLVCREIRDYRLLDGSGRRLVVFSRP